MLVSHTHAIVSLLHLCQPCAYIQQALCIYSASLVLIFSTLLIVGCIQKCHVVCRLQCPVVFFSVLIGKNNNDWWWERTISKVQGTRQMKAGHGHTHTHTHIYIHTNPLVFQQNSKRNYICTFMFTLHRRWSDVFWINIHLLYLVTSPLFSVTGRLPLAFFFFKFLCLSSVLVSFCHIFYSWWRPLCHNVKVFLCLCPIFFLWVFSLFFTACSGWFLLLLFLPIPWIRGTEKNSISIMKNESVMVWTLVKQQTVCLKSFF